MALRFIARYEKFNDSLQSLEKINIIDWPENKDLMGFIWCGVISKFCITFDLSYKLMKDILVEYHGVTDFPKGSPREILRQAYQSDMVEDELWLDMLKHRNEIVHEYKELSAVDEWCERITKDYLPLFQSLLAYTEKIVRENTTNGSDVN